MVTQQRKKSAFEQVIDAAKNTASSFGKAVGNTWNSDYNIFAQKNITPIIKSGVNAIKWGGDRSQQALSDLQKNPSKYIVFSPENIQKGAQSFKENLWDVNPKTGMSRANEVLYGATNRVLNLPSAAIGGMVRDVRENGIDSLNPLKNPFGLRGITRGIKEDYSVFKEAPTSLGINPDSLLGLGVGLVAEIATPGVGEVTTAGKLAGKLRRVNLNKFLNTKATSSIFQKLLGAGDEVSPEAINKIIQSNKGLGQTSFGKVLTKISEEAVKTGKTVKFVQEIGSKGVPKFYAVFSEPKVANLTQEAAKVVDDIVPPPVADNTIGSVKMMITKSERQALADLGYKAEDINKMKPSDASAIIANNMRKVADDISPPPATIDISEMAEDVAKVAPKLDESPYISPEVADTMQRIAAGENKMDLFKTLPNNVIQEATQRLAGRGLLADLDAAFAAQNYDDVSKFANQMIEDVATKGKKSVYYDYIDGLKNYLKFTPTVDQVALSSKIDSVLSGANTPEIPTAPKGKDVLGFIETSLKSDNVTNPVKEEILNQGERIFYEKASNQASLDRVKQLVAENPDLMLVRAMSGEKWTNNLEDIATNYLVLSQKAMREGNSEIARELLFKLGEAANKYGKFNQALTILNRLTPEGQLMYVSRLIKKIAPKAKRIEADSTARKIGEEIQKINDEVSDQVAQKVVEKFGSKIRSSTTGESAETTQQAIQRVKQAVRKKPPEQQLADKIRAVEDEVSKENPIKDMVNTLFQVAKEQLPKKAIKKRDPMDFISLAMNEKDKYVEVWDKAKLLVKAKYAENPEALKVLDDYFGKYLTQPFSDKLVDRAVRMGAKDLQIDIGQLIRKKMSVQISTQKKLVDELMSRGWILDPNDADEVERLIKSQFEQLTSDRKRQVLEGMLNSVKGKGKIEKSAIDRVIELTNMGALDNERYYELVAKKLKIPAMTNEMAEVVRKNMQLIKDIDDTKLTGFIQKNRMLRQMYKEINQLIPRTWQEQFDDYRYINMLLSPKTQLRNILSGFEQTFILRPTNLFWQQIGATKFAGGGSAKTNANVMQYYQDVFNALGDAGDAFIAVMQGKAPAVPMSSFMDYRQDITPNMVGIFGREKWGFLPNIGRFMEATDAYFATLISAGEYGRLKSLGLSDIDAHLGASKLAEEYLFRGFADPNETAPLVRGVDKAQAVAVKAINGLKIFGLRPLSWFVPFVKIMNNMNKAFMDYSPVGIINALTTKGDDALKAERAARAITGTIVLGLGAILAAHGQTTWRAPKDKVARDLFYAEKKKEYSIKIGGIWVPMVFFGPVAFALAVPAAIREAWVDNPNADVDSMWEKARNTVQNIFSFLSGQSYIAGMSAIIDALQGEDDTTINFALASIASQAVPAASFNRYINTIIDPYYKKSGDALGQFIKSWPLGTFFLPPYTDPNGNPQERDWYNAILPYDIGIPTGEFEAEYQERQEELKQNAIDRAEENSLDEEKKSTFDRILEGFGLKKAEAQETDPLFSYLKEGKNNPNVQLPQTSGRTVLSMDGQPIQVLGLSDYLKQENRNSKLLKAYLSGDEKRIARELQRAGMTPDEGVIAAIKSLNPENRAEFLYGEINKEGFTPQMLNTLIDNKLLGKTEAEWMVRKGLINAQGYKQLVEVIENRESEMGILKEKDPKYIASILNQQPAKDDTEAMNLIKSGVLTIDVINKMLMAEYISVEYGAHLKQLLLDYQISKGVKKAPRGRAPKKANTSLLKIQFKSTPKLQLGSGLSNTRPRKTTGLKIESAVPPRPQRGLVSTKLPKKTEYSFSGRLPVRVRNTMTSNISNLGR